MPTFGVQSKLHLGPARITCASSVLSQKCRKVLCKDFWGIGLYTGGPWHPHGSYRAWKYPGKAAWVQTAKGVEEEGGGGWQAPGRWPQGGGGARIQRLSWILTPNLVCLNLHCQFWQRRSNLPPCHFTWGKGNRFPLLWVVLQRSQPCTRYGAGLLASLF